MSAGTLPCNWDGFDAYLFDIDGTLLLCEDAVHYFGFCHVLKSASGQELTLDGVIAHGNTDTGIIRDALQLAGISEDRWRPMLPEMRAELCGFVEARRHELCTRQMPGAAAVLQHLKSRNAILGVATGNLRRVGELKLEHAGLLHYFDFGGWSDGYETRTEVFRAATELARKAAGHRASICVIGDTPADVRSAKAVGLPVIAVATGIFGAEELRAENPDLCIRDFGELLDGTASAVAQAL